MKSIDLIYEELPQHLKQFLLDWEIKFDRDAEVSLSVRDIMIELRAQKRSIKALKSPSALIMFHFDSPDTYFIVDISEDDTETNDIELVEDTEPSFFEGYTVTFRVPVKPMKEILNYL